MKVCKSPHQTNHPMQTNAMLSVFAVKILSKMKMFHYFQINENTAMLSLEVNYSSTNFDYCNIVKNDSKKKTVLTAEKLKNVSCGTFLELLTYRKILVLVIQCSSLW